MAKSVTGKFLVRLLGVLPLLLAAPAHAQNLPDPTRPPDSFGLDNTSAVTPSGPVLQSVLIAPGRKVAVISGQTVRLGEKFGTAQLVSVTEGEVVLREGEERTTLKLFPNLEKRPASSGAHGKAGSRRQ